MHEMSIAASMLDVVLQTAEQAGATRVELVEVEVGALKLVVPEVLQVAWEAVRADTLADGAILKIEEIPARAECRQCGRHFEPDIEYSFLCPACNRADVRIVRGDDIVLKSVTCQTESAAQAGGLWNRHEENQRR
jgi:hydrogenase nickel incorporation protein HypA/HybF